MSDNYRKAPMLTAIGDKFNNQGTYKAKTNEGYKFYQLPIPLLSYIFSIIPGKNGNIIKLLVFLLGSSSGFGISEKLVEYRTGLNHQAYCAARKWLIENDSTSTFFQYDKERKLIIIDYKALWKAVEDFEAGFSEEDEGNQAANQASQSYDFLMLEMNQGKTRAKYSWEE